MGKLPLDRIGAPQARLVQDGRRGAAESVNRCAGMVAQPVKPIDQRIFGNRLVPGLARQDPLRTACQVLEFREHGLRLRGQGHDVFLAHLHLFSGDAPCVPVQFIPRRQPQFGGANKSVRDDLQAQRRCPVPAVGLQRLEEVGQLIFLQGCPVLLPGCRLHRTCKGRGRVRGSPAIRHRKAKDRAHGLTQPLCHFEGVAVLHFAQQGQDFGRGDRCHVLRADLGEYVRVKARPDARRIAADPLGFPRVEPFPRRVLEGLHGRSACRRAFLRGRVNPRCQLVLEFSGFQAGSRKGNIGIRSEGSGALFRLPAIVHAPEF